MTKKVKISFLLLVWGIVLLQLIVNYQDREEIADIEKTKIVEKNIESADMVCP